MTASGNLTPPPDLPTRWGGTRPNGSLLRGSPRQERLHHLGELGGRGLGLLEVGLELQRVLVARLQRVVHRALGRGQRLARLLRPLACEIAYLCLPPVR